jgi:DNA polymerase I
MELECYDLSWDSDEGRLWLEALVDDGDGKAVETVPAPFDPYCYIEEDDLTMDPLRATGCRIGDGAPEGYLKIEADHPSAIDDFRDRFAFTTYEADVYYDRRVCINEDVSFARPDPGDVLYFDIEVDDRGSFASPEHANSRVIAIAAVGGDGEEHYFDDENERDLLRGFIEAADDYKVLAGWNALDYDFRYLENRYANKGMPVNWRRWVRHDVMPLYDMIGVPTKTVSKKLGDTGERELGEGKEDVQPGDGRLWALWNDDPDRLREYNMRDADIVRRVDEKFGLIETLHVICDLCNYPPGSSCYLTKHDQVKFAIGMVVDALLLEVAHDRGIPQHNRRSFDKPPDFPGGYVLDPEPGLYDWLMAPDYSGMYPNIVRSWNFGRETWVPDEHLAYDEAGDRWYITEGEHEGLRAIKGETGGFVHPDEGPRSVPAEAADRLVAVRAEAAEVVDKGVKAVNNCFSGDTEVMTPDRGPVNIKELEVGDRVYSINPDTMECEVKPIVETTAEPNAYGELVHIGGEGVDLKVTPNHRMLVSEYAENDFDFHEAYELESGRWDLPEHEPVAGRMPDQVDMMQGAEGRVLVDPDCHGHTFRSHIDGAEYDGNRGGYWLDMGAFWEQEAELLELANVVGVQHHANGKVTPLRHDPPDVLALMGWYISEGSLHSGDESRIKLSQRDDEERSRITSLLDSMGIPHSVYDDGVRISDANLASWLGENCGVGSGRKRIPDWVFELDHSLLEHLHGSLMRGDGSDDGRGSVKYTTVSEELRDDFARLMLHLGKRMRFREDSAHRVHENRTAGVAGPRNVSREDHDGMVYCVSVLDNHTVLAGRNGIMQWTGQTLYGVFASDFHRYFGPHSENITLIGQELTGAVERIAGREGSDVERVVYGDTDSVMLELGLPGDMPVEEVVERSRAVSDDIERDMREWAASKGAITEHLVLDLDDVYDRFYIGDRKKRYFGHRVYDGEFCDGFKVRGFEVRQNDWPEPVRDFQEELMHAVLDDAPVGGIIDEARDRLYSGEWDMEMATSKSLGQPPGEYDPPMPHSRAAEAIREAHGRQAVQVGDKVDYIKYGDGREDIAWLYNGELGVTFRPNEGWCPECGSVERYDDHPHEQEGWPHFRDRHYEYLWRKKFKSVMDSIGVDEYRQTGLGAFL